MLFLYQFQDITMQCLNHETYFKFKGFSYLSVQLTIKIIRDYLHFIYSSSIILLSLTNLWHSWHMLGKPNSFVFWSTATSLNFFFHLTGILKAQSPDLIIVMNLHIIWRLQAKPTNGTSFLAKVNIWTWLSDFRQFHEAGRGSHAIDNNSFAPKTRQVGTRRSPCLRGNPP